MVRTYHRHVAAPGTARLGLWVACVAQLMVVLDISVVNVALPSIRRDLALTAEMSSWVALAYTLGFAGALLVGARLADVVGTARALAGGVAAFTVASVIGGVADSGALLVGARAVQGLSAAVASPATFTLLTRTFDEGEERTRAIAIWTAVSLAGGGLGNVVSGVLTEAVSWRAVLLVNLPVGALVVAGTLLLRRREPLGEKGAGRLDLVGAALATGGFTAITYAFSAAGGSGGAKGGALAAVVGAGVFAALALQQRSARSPLVPSTLLRSRPVVIGNFATALTAVCFQVGLWYFLTFRMQDGLGLTPIEAGVAFLPLTAGTLAVNLWATPRLMRVVPAATLVVVGGVVAGLGLVWLAVTGGAGFVVGLLAPSIVVGVGGGLLNTPLATIVTTGVRPEEAGAASGLMNTAKQFGGAIGLAAASTAASAGGGDAAPFALMAGALAVVVVLAALLRRVSSGA